MIDRFLTVVKPIDAPGSTQFLALCIALGLVFWFVWPRNRRLARNWLIGVGMAYLVLALPISAKVISGALPLVATVAPSGAGPLDALLVFDGDNRRGRISAAGEAFAASKPAIVWVVGGQPDWLYDNLPEVGVPKERIRLESDPLTTRDQIAWAAQHRSAKPDERIAIVSSRLQVARIDGMLRNAGLKIPIIRAPIDTEPPTEGWQLILPMYIALRISRDGLYEHMALAYYRYNGWLQ